MRVLFIGNSHTFANNMPFIFSGLAKGAGEPVEAVMLATPGISLGWHAEQPETQANILYGSWDYVVLQQAAHPFAGRETLLNDSRKLVELISKTTAQPVLFMPWASKKDPGAQSEIEEAFESVSRELNTLLSPVGEIWWKLLHAHPEIELFDPDQEHANLAGSYLTACVFYSLFFGRPAAGIRRTELTLIPSGDAELIRQYAWDGVQTRTAQRRRDTHPSLGTVRYRPLNAGNPDELRAVARMHEEAPSIWEHGYKPTEERISRCVDKLRTASHSGKCLLLIAESDASGLIGFHWVDLDQDRSGTFGYIKSLWVKQEYQHLGIASEMKERGEDWTHTQGASWIKTTVHGNNKRMITFNLKHGFQPGFIEMSKRLGSDKI